MESINSKLQELYSSNYQNIISKLDSGKKLDGPHLMYCWDNVYNKANQKILFVGQEPTGWVYRDYLGIDNLDNIDKKIDKNDLLEDCIGCYQMIVNGSYGKIKRGFWKSVYEINEILNNGISNDLEKCFFYSNVSKYCNLEGKAPLSIDDHEYSIYNLNLLYNEIDIIKPDVVIFFTGPNYDEKIRIQFDEGLKFEQLLENVDKRELARVIHPILPKNSFRTYHPNSFRFGYTNYIPEILQILIESNFRINNSINQIKTQLSEISEHLKLDIKYGPDPFAVTESSVTFNKPKWNSFGIVLGFDSCLKDFYFGINTSDMLKHLPNKIREECTITFGNNPEEATPGTPWSKYFENYKDWNDETYIAIESGLLQKEINRIIGDLTNILDNNL